MHFSGFKIVLATASVAALAAAIFACTTAATTESEPNGPLDGGTGFTRDADQVDVFEGGVGPSSDAGTPSPPLSCPKYCELIQKHCTGDNAQYASKEDCFAFCEHLPPGEAYDLKKTAGLYCRQYYAGNPSLTDPDSYCAAAGPFGGGLCGDRCTAFCQVALSACGPDSGATIDDAPYASPPSCKSACFEYTYREAGVDGGGEGLDGPARGDTLNCRLYHLRKAVMDAGACRELGVDAGNCR